MAGDSQYGVRMFMDLNQGGLLLSPSSPNKQALIVIFFLI